jgi:hypothetical protein
LDGIARSQEYSILDLSQLNSGPSLPNFGALHDVGLDIPAGPGRTERRLRSVCLPWTIGLEVERTAAPALARVIVRVSDILGHRLTTPLSPGVATGIGSVGFKRLMWFDLIVTAYLDALDLLGGGPKTIQLVYYDCREVDFTDVGLSPRMLESVLAMARSEKISSDFDRLSDVLSWLAFRQFKISVCVDSEQARQPGMSAFLGRLVALGRGNVSIVQKRIPGGHMHKKILVTPIAVLKGSANLSVAGTRESEELIDHFFAGTGAYSGAKTNAQDTFTGAEQWHPLP